MLKQARDRATPSEPTLKHVEGDRAPALPERYRVERELGRGGMGRVFAARDEKLGRDVAIKVLAVGNGDEETLRRFEQEARAAALLEHPNIVAVYDIGQHENGPYIISELLRGETLRDRMAGKPLRVEDALDYATQIAMGLTAAHDKGVIHRDLKPENLFITRDVSWASPGSGCPIGSHCCSALSRWQVDGLRVIGRTSSFSMKGRNEDLRTIGQRLGATNLLEGSVRKSGARVRITAQLVEAEGGSRIWSQEFDRELTDVFAVQGEIAHAVVAALKVKLLPAAREDPRAANPEAYDLYLLGRAFRARGSGDAYERAVQALRRSVALDPGHAQAWAELAQALYDVGDFSVKGDRKVDRPEGLVAAEKAIALAPQRADGYSARGVLRLRMLQDWTGARADLERARSLNPRSPGILANHAMLLTALGGLTEAIAICQHAAVLDPLSADIQFLLNAAYLGTGQFALAEAAASRALEVSPEHARAARNLGITLLLQNRVPDARAAFHRSNHEFVVSMGDVMVEHALGHSAESQRALDSILAGPYAEVAAYQIVQMYAWRGETDRAFAWLGRAAELHDPGLTYLKFDPLLHGLRGDARLAAQLKKMNLPTD